MKTSESQARLCNDSALAHFEASRKERFFSNDKAAQEAWCHETGLHAAAVKAGHPSALAWMNSAGDWGSSVKNLFAELE